MRSVECLFFLNPCSPTKSKLGKMLNYWLLMSHSIVLACGSTETDPLTQPKQELICLRAIRDVNVPKFLQDDLKLFSGIVSDLFPKIKEEPIDYGTLEESIRNVCAKKCLKDVDGESRWGISSVAEGIKTQAGALNSPMF